MATKRIIMSVRRVMVIVAIHTIIYIIIIVYYNALRYAAATCLDPKARITSRPVRSDAVMNARSLVGTPVEGGQVR